MNYKYQKKPIIIEAFQMTKERRSNNKDWPGWFNKAWNSQVVEPDEYDIKHGKIKIKTLEGDMVVDWDDYIIKGIEGELYPCKPDIFNKSYGTIQTNDKKVGLAKKVFGTDSYFDVLGEKTCCIRALLNYGNQCIDIFLADNTNHEKAQDSDFKQIAVIKRSITFTVAVSNEIRYGVAWALRDTIGMLYELVNPLDVSVQTFFDKTIEDYHDRYLDKIIKCKDDKDIIK